MDGARPTADAGHRSCRPMARGRHAPHAAWTLARHRVRLRRSSRGRCLAARRHGHSGSRRTSRFSPWRSPLTSPNRQDQFCRASNQRRTIVRRRHRRSDLGHCRAAHVIFRTSKMKSARGDTTSLLAPRRVRLSFTPDGTTLVAGMLGLRAFADDRPDRSVRSGSRALPAARVLRCPHAATSSRRQSRRRGVHRTGRQRRRHAACHRPRRQYRPPVDNSHRASARVLSLAGYRSA